MSYLTREDLIDEALRRALFPFGGVQDDALPRLRKYQEDPMFPRCEHEGHVPGWVAAEFARLLPVLSGWSCAEGGPPSVKEILAAWDRRRK